MDNSKLTARAKFLTSPKSPGVAGVLMLSESKFAWKSNDPKAAQNLEVSFHSIKVHRANKETPKFQKALLNMFKDAEMKEGYLFEFDNFKDRDECRNFVDVEGLRDTMTVANALLNAKEGEASPSNETSQEQRRLERVHEMTKVDDLEGPEAQPFVPLCIQDPRSYFDSQRPNLESAGSISSGSTGKPESTPSNPREILSAFKRHCSELQAVSFTGGVVVPEAATRVLHELTHYISNRKFQVGKHAGNFLDSLPRTTKEELLQLSATSHELLRHFWAAFPLTSNALRDKASRIKGALMQIQSKLQGLLKESEKREYRHPLSQLSQSLIQALDAAILHYENEEKRSLKSSQKNSASNGVPTLV